ncbi:ADP-ribosylglycohydrolase family protein [bacterium]|nr:ADP-ribosylglycohydrolase family protein [bacterium]
MRKIQRIQGSVLALALGDAFGAPHEGRLLEKADWAVIGRSKGKRRWTDDTQMTINIIESLVACGRIDQNDLAYRFAHSYCWSRGYGPGAARILKRIRKGQSWEAANLSVYRDGSFGNGGAMRAPAVGLFFASCNEDDIVKAASDSAAVTHAHPLGREGAKVIALATALAFNEIKSLEIIERLIQHAKSSEFLSKFRTATAWLSSGKKLSPSTVATKLGNGISAVDSCVTAIFLALTFRNRSFDELMEFVIKLRGDVDTIAAMACAIWGAVNGLDALPKIRLEQLEQYDRLMVVARSLAETDRKVPTNYELEVGSVV